MCNKPKDEEYYQRQSNIGALLLQAYLDKYILESIDEFKLSISKETPSGIGNTIFMIAHICDLTKRDLALTLWKVFYDDSDDANTIKKLNRYLFAHYKIKYKRYGLSLVVLGMGSLLTTLWRIAAEFCKSKIY